MTTGTDFVAADDYILLRAHGFGGGLRASYAISSDQFTLGMSAVDARDRIIYNNISGELFFDCDGTGAQAQVLLATLTGAPSLNSSNFVLS
jgi:Ca2+-binding RTX toxin-like protein